MAAVYLDEDAWLGLGVDLRAYGHDVAIARDQVPLASSDALHFLTATHQERTLVTCNRRDFELLHDAWHYWASAWGVPNEHSGVIVVGQELPRPAHTASILALVAAELPFRGHLYEWRGGHSGGWYSYDQGLRTRIIL